MSENLRIKFSKDAKKKLAQKYKLNYLILLDSQSLNQATKLSGYDIAYSSRRELDYGEEVFLAEDIGRELKVNPEKIDLVNTGNASPLLAKKIAYNGRLILELTPNSFDNFQIYAFMIYIEAKPLLKMRADYVKRNQPKL